MKTIAFLFALLQISILAFADDLPQILSNPQNASCAVGGVTGFGVTASDATSFQWRFNGVDIPGATNSEVQIGNTQVTNSGYYMVIARNSTGWTPSQMAYLAVISSAGKVGLSNLNNTAFLAQATYQQTGPYDTPITGGKVQVVAGPELDQLQLISSPAIAISNGYFNFPISSGFTLPNVSAGQTFYYSVYITYTNAGIIYTQQSTVLKLVAGGTKDTTTIPLPSTANLKFPVWIEWPEPLFFFENVPDSLPPTNQLRVPGETVSFALRFLACKDLGVPTVQWRKDGQIIPGATNVDLHPNDTCGDCTARLTLTNIQPADAGIYDLEIFGSKWLTAPKLAVSVQTGNRHGLLNASRFDGTNFVSDLTGASGRIYTVQWSSDLITWNDLVTLSNTNGTVTFSNATVTAPVRFYRTKLISF